MARKDDCRISTAMKLLACIFLSVSVSALAAQSSPFIRIETDTTVLDGGWSFGASWIDYDNDNYPDLFISNNIFEGGGELNYLYHNNGDGTYTRISTGDIASEGHSVASTWADYDGDGDLDGYVSCNSQLNYFYSNNGDGTFTKMASGPLGGDTEATMDACWTDYDNDGLLDLFVVNHKPPSIPDDIICALYRNNGSGFDLQDNTAIGLLADEGNSTAWGDYDNDGDRDLFWSRNENLSLIFNNDGDGTFTQNTGSVLAASPRKYHGSWADFDNDGDLDIYVGQGYPGTPHLYENVGGDFSEVTGTDLDGDVGYWTGGYWGDYDNDGWIDLYVIGSEYYQPSPNRLYHNNGDGTFTKITTGVIATDLEPTSAAVWADHDRDGDLDLFVANVSDSNNSLYENTGNSNHWIQMELEGIISNRSGIGAKIRLKAPIVTSGPSLWQMREITAHSGFMAQNDLVAHFGLGDAAVIDTIRVEWPSGIVQILENVSADQYMNIREPWLSKDANSCVINPSNAHNVELLYTLTDHNNGVWNAVFSPDGSLLATAAQDRMVMAREVDNPAALTTFSGHLLGWVLGLAFSPDGQYLASAGTDGFSGIKPGIIRIWNLTTNTQEREFPGHAEGTWSLDIQESTGILASCGKDGLVKLWDISNGDLLNTFTGHISVVLSVDFSPTQDLVASSGVDNTVRIWNSQTGEAVHVLTGHANNVGFVKFSPDGATLASSSDDRTVRLWDVADGTQLWLKSVGQGWVNCVNFNPDGDLLMTCGHDGSVALRLPSDGTELIRLDDHTGPVLRGGFNPAGTVFATASWDNTVRIWGIKNYIDSDADGVPDGCDRCEGFDDNIDSDLDMVPDMCDLCEGYDDNIDSDSDSVPDACDLCEGYDDNQDTDSDLVPDSCDNCPETYNPEQTDSNSNNVGDACDYVCGNSNGDGSINIGDVVYLVNLIFHDGPMPDPQEAGDVNCDGGVNVGDAVFMANYIFQEDAPEPCASCP